VTLAALVSVCAVVRISNHMYLYAIKDSHSGLIKLGYSSDPVSRLRELQTGSSSVLVLVHTELVSSDARILERELHRDINHLRVRGEWFRLSESSARDLIQWCVIRYD
jgi:hypothetical protein